MTISEVMVAAVLLGFVIMSSLTALSQSYNFTNHARMVTLASQIAQSVMEDFRLRNYGQLQALAAQSQPLDLTSTLSSERFASGFTQFFTVRAQFTTLVASSPGHLGKISVVITVAWTEQGAPFSRKLMTIFGEKGLSDYYYVGWTP